MNSIQLRLVTYGSTRYGQSLLRAEENNKGDLVPLINTTVKMMTDVR